MKVEKIREKDGKLELLVELTVAETSEDMQRIAVYEIGKNGWDYDGSTGISPADFLKQQLGSVESSFVFDEGIMRHRAAFALTAAKVDTIGTPVFRCAEHAEEGKPFKYQLVCVPVPEFELDDYGPVTITVPSETVKEDEIDEEIQRMAATATVPVTDTSHDTVVKGDKVELAMTTTMDGNRVRGLCTEGREYTTGTFAMPDEFDDGIIGMKAGETKTIKFQGPEMELDENGQPIMKDYESTVTIKRIIASRATAIDDEWARSVKPGIESLDDLRKDVAEKIKERHEQDFERTAQLFAGNELAKRFQGSISDLIYGVAVKEARENFDQQLKSMNLTLDAYLAQEDMTQEQLNNALMMQVRQQLTRQFALNAYAKHYDLVVGDADLDEFFESIAPGKANIAHADFNRDGRMYSARCAALRLKASRHAVEHANVTRLGESEQS